MSTSPYEIVVGAGQIWVAAVGTAFPDVDDATPAAGWTDLGDTEGGVTITPSIEIAQHGTDQSLLPKKGTISAYAMGIAFQLAEPTLDHLAKILGGTVVDNAATETDAGYKELVLAAPSSLATYAMLARVPSAEADGYRQYEFACVSPDGENGHTFTKTDKATFPTQWICWEDPSNAGQFGSIKDYTAAATG